MHDSNEIAKSKPMFSVSGYTTGLVRTVSDVRVHAWEVRDCGLELEVDVKTRLSQLYI